ncbi:MAG: exosortase/archaeosortase family protein [Candidatus Omnitrophota bacterium]
MNEKKNAIIKFAVGFILLIVAYIPTLQWMLTRWNAAESYYGHGFLIPFISLYFVWQRRGILGKAKISSSGIGLAMIAAGLLLHIMCAVLRVYFISGFSFVLVLYGLIFFTFGKEIAKNLMFPVLFLLTMIPLPLVMIGNLIVKLKLLVAQTATLILNLTGFPSIRDGSTIRMPNSYVVVAAPCSGLRSLISLLTLGLLFASVMKVSLLKKSILFLSSVPIAIAANITRVTLFAMINDLYGEKVSQGFFHDFSGFLLFGVAFAGLYGVSRVLERTRDGRPT